MISLHDRFELLYRLHGLVGLLPHAAGCIGQDLLNQGHPAVYLLEPGLTQQDLQLGFAIQLLDSQSRLVAQAFELLGQALERLLGAALSRLSFVESLQGSLGRLALFG